MPGSILERILFLSGAVGQDARRFVNSPQLPGTGQNKRRMYFVYGEVQGKYSTLIFGKERMRYETPKRESFARDGSTAADRRRSGDESCATRYAFTSTIVHSGCAGAGTHG